MRGLWRGIDPRHVLWRLETPLRKVSFDFEPAAACLSLLFCMWNYTEEKTETSKTPAASMPAVAARLATTPEEAMQFFMANEKSRGNGALADKILLAHGRRELVRPSDGCAMPETVVRLMLRWLGLGQEAHRLRPLEPTTAYFVRELDALEGWFSVGMAKQKCPHSVKTKHGWHRRARLQREDGAKQERHMLPAVGELWSKAKRNQQRPIVVNALLASYETKRFLVQELGPGATSLGGVGVERGHFVDKIQDTAPTAIWATNACKQYRAIVKWKRSVRATMRSLLVRFGKERKTSKRAQHILESCEGLLVALQSGSRTPLLSLNAEPDQPDDSMINVGLDEFRIKLVDARVFEVSPS